ncbi:MAG: SCO1664 family protein, partial [Antricoccus sp.]
SQDCTDLDFLASAQITVIGRLRQASNATLLCTIETDSREGHCVYKPVMGERPLWDYPDGTLAGRELASYEISAATGWGLIPPTVLRDGPLGSGMVQLWMDGDENVDLLDLVNSRGEQLRRIAVLDAVINNSDRKGSHLIPMPGLEPLSHRPVYGIDHGVSFGAEDKLRTVLWHWAGESLTDDALTILDSLRAGLASDRGERLARHLTRTEVRCARRRVERMLQSGIHPLPSEDWPSIPYPPF